MRQSLWTRALRELRTPALRGGGSPVGLTEAIWLFLLLFLFGLFSVSCHKVLLKLLKLAAL